LVQAPTKNGYWFLKFSDRPCDPSKIKFLLNKPTTKLDGSCSSQDANLNPVRIAVYTGRSLPDTWHPEHQLLCRNPERSHSAETGVYSSGIGAFETLVSSAPIVAHWRVPIDCCSKGPLLLVQCQLISINKLVSCEKQYNSIKENRFH
jgi:hypothetical protein